MPPLRWSPCHQIRHSKTRAPQSAIRQQAVLPVIAGAAPVLQGLRCGMAVRHTFHSWRGELYLQVLTLCAGSSPNGEHDKGCGTASACGLEHGEGHPQEISEIQVFMPGHQASTTHRH